jgi:hypothetical protein
MSARAVTLLWLLPVCVAASVVGSLLAAWLVSLALGLSFNPVLVAALSGAISAALVSVRILWPGSG